MDTDASIPPESQRAELGSTSDRQTAAASTKACTLLQRAESLYAKLDVAHEKLNLSDEELAVHFELSKTFDALGDALQECAAGDRESPLEVVLHGSIPAVSCYLLSRIHKPEALSVFCGRALMNFLVLVSLYILPVSINGSEEADKLMTMRITELLCGAVGAGVFTVAYPLFGAAAATGLSGLVILVILVSANTILHFLPPDVHNYLRATFRKDDTEAALPDPAALSPTRIRATLLAQATTAIVRGRTAVEAWQALIRRRTALDAGPPVFYALPMFLSEALVPFLLQLRISEALVLGLAAIPVLWRILGSLAIAVYYAAYLVYGAGATRCHFVVVFVVGCVLIKHYTPWIHSG
ncbi:hypothetical protein FA95DRAFT_1596795 [Auriscalpium vulgare]|uniref:Uncharacterized protein n=1 Tax=Auriscalpium vulgare TaxID=40419 RepID=A0ACB8RNV7_9AGAM|nr:hypothetical protein FA95DRAFT_1596795 [Auriscalpium vulgare]